jgi:hypothetical protein
MLSVFGGSLSFEEGVLGEESVLAVEDEQKGGEQDERGYDDWLLQRKVKLPRSDEWVVEGELSGSRCFGTRTVEDSIGMDCVWKLHGGI